MNAVLRGALSMALATAGFAVLHSALASDRFKRGVERKFGTSAAGSFHRAAYNAQAVVTFALLVRYGRALPSRTLYETRGKPALLLRAGQAGGLLWAALAARETGALYLSGLPNVAKWLQGTPARHGPAAQGPERPDGDDALRVGGPFRWSRHPLNFAPLPVLWLTPRLTTVQLAFNVVATAYMVLGSVHEELRLLRCYGDEYRAYLAEGVPFFLPRPPAKVD